MTVWYINYGPWGPRSNQVDDAGAMYGSYAVVIATIIAAISGYKGYEYYQESIKKRN
jgi:hypothetical protein